MLGSTNSWQQLVLSGSGGAKKWHATEAPLSASGTGQSGNKVLLVMAILRSGTHMLLATIGFKLAPPSDPEKTTIGE